ncbi:hypothetical protein C8Q74DRAFT_1369157 [Fomes fomentarius]|nr:hypothetical protein C8Q74DRAFT_1369157 [Fomes fomentarius]
MGTPAVDIYGPIFIGVVFNIALYGIMVTQTYLYFNVYRRDKIWMKILVFVLFFCDTLNCCFDVAFLYIPLVNNFGDTEKIIKADWIFATDPVMTAIIAALVQLFFAWRVKILTGHIFSVCVIVVSSVAQLCGGLGTSIAVGMIPEFTNFQKFKVIVIIWLAFSAVADTLITTALVWHLRKNKTGMVVTDGIINRIIRLTVQTGLITALCAIIDLILFLIFPTGLHLIFNLPLSKLYTNSLMSSLNSRQGWQYDSSTGVSQNRAEQPNGLTRPRNVNVNMLRSENGRRGPQEIYIDVESHEMVDVDAKPTHPYANASGPYVPDQKMTPVSSDGEMA